MVLLGPGGLEFDVSDRVGDNGIGTIGSATEENFLELTHGDVDITLLDDDAAVEQFLVDVDPADAYEVTIERVSGLRRPKYERVFGGILDLPWSIRINRKDRTVSLQAFSYSKLLERASADAIKRTFALTGNVSSGNKLVTVSPDTTGLEPGDEIEFNDDTNTESQIIAEIRSASQVRTIDNWGSSFAAGSELNVLTPYHRNLPLQDLVDLVFAAAGITSIPIDVLTPLAEFPIATPASTRGFTRDQSTGDPMDPKCLLPRLGNLEAWGNPNGTTVRLYTPSPTGSWSTELSPGKAATSDWTPYFETEPSNFRDCDIDDGIKTAMDHINDQLWKLVANGGTGWDLERNGSTIITLMFSGITTSNAKSSIEVNRGDITAGLPAIWVSNTSRSGDGVDRNRIKVRPGGGGGTVTLETAFSGELRYLRRLNLMACHQYAVGNPPTPTTNLRLYDAATSVMVRDVTVPQNLLAWSLRVFNDAGQTRIGGLYLLRGTMRLRIWDDTWTQVADYQVASNPAAPSKGGGATRTFLTVFTTLGQETLAGICGKEFFVLGRGYAGVVPYADFSGASCAEALREIALISMSYVEVDHFKLGSLRSRTSRNTVKRLQAYEIDEPLERVSWPVYEFYRTSAKISGTDSSGGAVSAVTGEAGDSAHRLELDGKLVSTGGLAEAIGLGYVSQLAVKRRQEELSFVETGQTLTAGDYIYMDGAFWRLLETNFDLKARKIAARAMED